MHTNEENFYSENRRNISKPTIHGRAVNGYRGIYNGKIERNNYWNYVEYNKGNERPVQPLGTLQQSRPYQNYPYETPQQSRPYQRGSYELPQQSRPYQGYPYEVQQQPSEQIKRPYDLTRKGRYTTTKQNKDKMEILALTVQYVRKLSKAIGIKNKENLSDKDNQKIVETKKQLKDFLREHKLLSAITSIVAATILLCEGIIDVSIKQPEPEPDRRPFTENTTIEEEIGANGETEYIIRDLDENEIARFYKNDFTSPDLPEDRPNEEVQASSNSKNTNTLNIENLDENSSLYWIEQLPEELISDLAKAIIEGNANIPSNIYNTYKINGNLSEIEIVRDYVKKVDMARGNPHYNISVLYQAPDVLLTVIKYYYAQTKNANKDMINVYYDGKKTDGKVYIATAQESRNYSDANPRKLHTARDNGGSLSDTDNVILSYATLDNIAGKVGFAEVDWNYLVCDSIERMSTSLPGVFRQIVENEKINDIDDR